MELAKGAELRAIPNRDLYPKFPGMIQSWDEKEEYNLGTWEGNPMPMFAGVITGLYVENVLIYGEGTINGFASKEDWWDRPKVMRGAFRPRLFFISHCKNVTLQGIKLCNSPSWTLHPYFSDDLGFYNLTIENPSDSPNTDGLDPESCKNVLIAGVRFSLGDDCIAVKSGKIYMGRKYKTPSENIRIRQCLMENGHGAVTIGSEMAGGVRRVYMHDCKSTDAVYRMLYLKTNHRRGGFLEDIWMENVSADKANRVIEIDTDVLYQWRDIVPTFETKIPRKVIVPIIYLILFVLIGWLVFTLIPLLISRASSFISSMIAGINSMYANFNALTDAGAPVWVQRFVRETVTALQSTLTAMPQISGRVSAVLSDAIDTFTVTVLTLILSMYMCLSWEQITSEVKAIVRRWGAPALRGIHAVDSEIGG